MAENRDINQIKLHRMIFFTDAVLAIILTLLVLELHLPELADANSPMEMVHQLGHILPHIYAFLLCFLALAQCWLGFNSFFSLVEKYDDTLGALNTFMLLPLCLIPFACSIIGDYPDNSMSFVVFGGLYLITSSTLTFMTNYMWKRKMFSPKMDAELFEKVALKNQWLTPVIITLIIASAFISTKLSLGLFFCLLIMWIYMMKYLKLTKEEKE